MKTVGKSEVLPRGKGFLAAVCGIGTLSGLQFNVYDKTIEFSFSVFH